MQLELVMRKARRGWVMPEEDARAMLRLIEERMSSSVIRVEHRDVLIRLRGRIEDDLAEAGHCQPEGLHDRPRFSPGPGVRAPAPEPH
jgi:hypothetical protein